MTNAIRKDVAPTRRRVVALAVAGLLSTIAWGTGHAAGDTEAFSRIGASFPVVEFGKGDAFAANLGARASGFASVLAGEPVRAASSVLQRAPAHAQFQVRREGGVHVLAEASRAVETMQADPLATDAEVAARTIATTPAPDRLERIRVVADSDQRDLLAVNAAVADDFTSRWDVGPERARSVFESTVQSMSSSRLLADQGLAPDAVRTHRLMQAEQAVGKPAAARVKEYLFEIPHAVGGVEIFGAATTVAVHRSGELASIRSTGPAVSVSPTRGMVTRTVSAEALAQRAVAEHPNAKVVPVGLRYPWQATSNAALASRPREVFQIIPVALAQGRKVNGRAHYVFYSVEDERAAPLVWPKRNR
jgi:hypothetical protein